MRYLIPGTTRLVGGTSIQQWRYLLCCRVSKQPYRDSSSLTWSRANLRRLSPTPAPQDCCETSGWVAIRCPGMIVNFCAHRHAQAHYLCCSSCSVYCCSCRAASFIYTEKKGFHEYSECVLGPGMTVLFRDNSPFPSSLHGQLLPRIAPGSSPARNQG